MECEPALDYGRSASAWEYDGRRLRHRRVGRPPRTTTCTLRLTTDLRMGFEGGRARARTTLRDGDTAFVALSLERARAARRPTTRPTTALVYTADFWHEWLTHGEFPDHPWRALPAAQRADAQGPDLRPDRRDGRRGHHVAARDARRRAQLGLPLLLDPRLHVHALGPLHARLRLGGQRLLLLHRATSRAADEDLQIMYGIGGERELAEETLDHLDGYEGARPVRIGNGAYDQQPARRLGRAARLDLPAHASRATGWPRRVGRSSAARSRRRSRHWREPDRGIWEVRGEPQHFVSSKVMCWVACDRGARLARLREDRERAERWQAAADEIHADVLEHGVDDRGVFVQHYDTDRAGRLVPADRRSCASCPPTTRAIVATVNAIADELTDDGLVLRYRVDETDDGLERRGGHVRDLLVLAGQRAGRDRRDAPRPRAVREAARLRLAAADLYAEEIDARSGPPPGQLPAGLHPPRAHQRRHARDPRRPRARVGHSRSIDDAPDGEHPPPMSDPDRSSAAPTPRPSPTAPRRSLADRDRRRPRGARRGPRRASSGGSTLAARLRAARTPSAPSGATCTSGTATSASCPSTTRSPTTGWRSRHLDAPRRDAGIPVAVDARPRGRRRGLRRRARRRPCSTSRCTGMGPDGHTASLFPGLPQLRADGRRGRRSATRPSRRPSASR